LKEKGPGEEFLIIIENEAISLIVHILLHIEKGFTSYYIKN